MFRVASFVILYSFWLVLSGKFDPFHLSLGFISCLIETLWSHDLLFEYRHRSIAVRLAILPRFVAYCIWLFSQIVLANLYVIYLALHPKMKEYLSPQMVRFKTTLKSDIAQVILANSITLTPGTITVRIENGEFVVHALTARIAQGIGSIEERIGRVFKGRR